jgi:dienelactone hydrolase
MGGHVQRKKKNGERPMKRENMRFKSQGLECAGWYYKTAGKGKSPCVVLGHGFGGVKEARLDVYAEAFAEAGYNALAFDYRHFGESEGEPRQILDIKKQHQDWHAAIAFARSQEGVDPNKIILWGSSFAGGHVIPVAIKDGKIAAVISQVPNLDGLATARTNGVVHALKLSLAASRDILRSVRGRNPYYIPIAGEPGELAAMTAPGARDAVEKLFPHDFKPNEDVAARIILHVPFYSPGGLARKMSMPWLIQAAEHDAVTPVKPAFKAAANAPQSKLITYKCGHFDVYLSPLFEQVIQDQVMFLKNNVN